MVVLFSALPRKEAIRVGTLGATKPDFVKLSRQQHTLKEKQANCLGKDVDDANTLMIPSSSPAVES